jgi:hypothetical protein
MRSKRGVFTTFGDNESEEALEANNALELTDQLPRGDVKMTTTLSVRTESASEEERLHSVERQRRHSYMREWQ